MGIEQVIFISEIFYILCYRQPNFIYARERLISGNGKNLNIRKRVINQIRVGRISRVKKEKCQLQRKRF
jgi:hypothetical protein